MKVLSKVLEGIGFASLMVGGAAMDSVSMVFPITLAMVGLGILFLGWHIDEEYVS